VSVNPIESTTSNILSRQAAAKPSDLITTEAELVAALTYPSSTLVDFINTLSSPLVILGAGGKMGPTLAVLARRAAEAANHKLEVLAVSQFTNQAARDWLENQGVKTIAANLLEAEAVARLPDAENILYLVGLKFGTDQNASATWAMNTVVPARITGRYPRARIVALSTGNVYPLSPVAKGGSVETDPLTPLGEYPNAAVGRERVFEFFSLRNRTPVAQLRLYYAVELRYGVLMDIATRIKAGELVDLANGYFNCIWQGDANEMIIRSLPLAASPPTAWNLCRPEIYQVRDIAGKLGKMLRLPVKFSGVEAPSALLGNASSLCNKLGKPATSMDEILRQTAHWVKQGGRTLGKPTHFEVRDGKY
jgi:nucleoside-diphosphate-sugar epimerase